MEGEDWIILINFIAVFYTVIYMKIERFHTWLLKAFCNLIGLVKKGVQESEGEAKIRSQKAISKLCC